MHNTHFNIHCNVKMEYSPRCNLYISNEFQHEMHDIFKMITQLNFIPIKANHHQLLLR